MLHSLGSTRARCKVTRSTRATSRSQWVTLDGAVEIHENRDDVTTVSNLEHDRSYSFTAMLAPNPRVLIDFGYNYWDVYTQSEICFNYSITYTNPAPPPTTLPVSTSPPGVAADGLPDCGRIRRRSGTWRPFHLRQHGPLRARGSHVEAREAYYHDARLRR